MRLYQNIGVNVFLFFLLTLTKGVNQDNAPLYIEQTSTDTARDSRYGQETRSPALTIAAWSPNGDSLAVSHYGESVCVLNTNTPYEVLYRLAFRDYGLVLALAFHPDGTYLATGHETGKIYFWNTENGEEIGSIDAHEGGVEAIAFSPDGSLLVSGGVEDYLVRFWNLETHSQVHEIDNFPARIPDLAFSPDGLFLAIPYTFDAVRLWEIKTLTETYLQDLPMNPQATINALTFDSTGRILAVSTQLLIIDFWDIATQERLNVRLSHPAETFDIAFSPDGSILASANGGLYLWQLSEKNGDLAVSQGVELYGISENNTIFHVAFNPDGTLLVATGDTIQLWKLGSENELTILDLCISYEDVNQNSLYILPLDEGLG